MQISERLWQAESVCLTRIGDEDMNTVLAWYEDGEFMRLLDAATAYPKKPEDVRLWLRDSGNYVFGIRTRVDGRLIGYAELNGILWNQGVAWLAIAIGEPGERNQGYGQETVRLLLRYAFGELNLRRVQLSVFSYNASAIQVYEKCGFQREGTYREFLFRDGEVHDMYLYGILRREWEQARV